jgi:hypothetical protein
MGWNGWSTCDDDHFVLNAGASRGAGDLLNGRDAGGVELLAEGRDPPLGRVGHVGLPGQRVNTIYQYTKLCLIVVGFREGLPPTLGAHGRSPKGGIWGQRRPRVAPKSKEQAEAQ